jgi:hypothetical protein
MDAGDDSVLQRFANVREHEGIAFAETSQLDRDRADEADLDFAALSLQVSAR